VTQFANHIRVAQGGKTEVTIHFSYVESASEEGDHHEPVESITVPFDVWQRLGAAAAEGYAKSDGGESSLQERGGDAEGGDSPGPSP